MTYELPELPEPIPHVESRRDAGERPPAIERLVPLEKNFYSKVIRYNQIPIKSAEAVDDRALQEAWKRLHMMLAKVPEIAANLSANGAELHIIGKNQVTSDLPENSQYKGKPFAGAKDFDERTRGVGGLFASCGEENLLRLKEDRYFGSDICVHEFAHTIYTYGLNNNVRESIKKQYESSLDKGKWSGCYAATNVEEFFAELSTWFFGSHGDYGKISPSPKVGPTWLKEYDADAFTVLSDLYSGRTKVARPPSTVLQKLPVNIEAKVKSTSSAIPTEIRFVNELSYPVKVYWLDYQGKRAYYAEVEPHATFTQQTFLTHPWLVTDGNEKPLAIFLPTEQLGVAIIK